MPKIQGHRPKILSACGVCKVQEVTNDRAEASAHGWVVTHDYDTGKRFVYCPGCATRRTADLRKGDNMKDKNGTAIATGDEVNVLVRAKIRDVSAFASRLIGPLGASRDLNGLTDVSIIEVTKAPPVLKPGQIYRVPGGALYIINHASTVTLIRDTRYSHNVGKVYPLADANTEPWELVVDA